MLAEERVAVMPRHGGILGLAIAAMALLLVVWLSDPAQASAFSLPGASFTETPVATGPGDQVDPVLQDGVVVYNDQGLAGSGWLVRALVESGVAEPLAGPGIVGRPGIDGGFIAWLNLEGAACMMADVDGAESCVDLPEPAQQLAFAGDKAVTSHGAKVIRLVNFGTGRSKILDSSTSTGNRYDPAIEGDRAVWIKERGYAGQYYEPLIVDYDLATDTYTYMTATGGGASSSGESLYERANPDLGGGEVVYQQRIREPGEQWDIYRAVPETQGSPLVTMPGDQVNPAVDGGIVVYQDNRSGHLDENGEWTGEWDLYLLDLNTGVEVPLCTEPGDQVNPRISGDVIVWQDNRDGDWDIYAAALDSGAGPAMSARIDDAYWNDYAAFQARDLTVRYILDNSGDGIAGDFTLHEVDTVPADVTAGLLPVVVGDIAPGGAATLEVHYQVPQGVLLFKTALFASCLDGSGNELWYPYQPYGTS